jgi:hypothetical protein
VKSYEERTSRYFWPSLNETEGLQNYALIMPIPKVLYKVNEYELNILNKSEIAQNYRLEISHYRHI